MKSEWPQCTILRAASFLVPGDQRAEWLHEWQSELWYIARRGALRFCLGAFQDALWLRRNNPNTETVQLVHLESPVRCLALLAALAAVSLVIAVRLPVPDGVPPPHLRASDLPAGCLEMLLLSCAFLLAFGMGSAPANRHLMPWPGRLRRGIFLALKIALVQPFLFCGFLAMLPIASVPIGLVALWLLRWVLTDQRLRCPVCLRLLTNPVRVGSPSETFLGWYGTESICSRGQGLLHTPEMSTTYSRRQEWVRLGGSWSGLFSKTR